MARTPSTSVLGRSLVVEGEVRGDSGVVLRGRVQGRVDVTGVVRVEPGAVARADLSGRDVEVAGEVTGDLRAQDRVEVFPEGRVTGDIRAPRVLIAHGAVFKGNVAL